MPIIVSKAKPVEAPKVVEKIVVEPAKMSDEDLADLWGKLNDKIAALALDPIYQQFKDVNAELMTRLVDIAPQDSATVKGNHWQLDVGPCAKSPRKITDVNQVAVYVGDEAFAKIAKIGISDAEKYLTPEQLATVVSEEKYTTNRKINAVFLG